MFGFLLGVAVGAAGYWAYRFWKGDDSSWDQSWNTDTGASNFSGSPSPNASTSQVGGGSMPTAIGGSASGSTAPGGPTSAEGVRQTPE